ncbi:ABC transporter ATP-binding protein [Anaerococcus sp. AGMB09787]|uniref:ATP-binding cassette domain-containing protein n=1 Tax=Anaerococcus sp. AGMB09787 TaxID=2922869 RepID=UPI001FB027DC|nr:ABC transporter ATP-binding protein [Anaerococcus sp. AGMB09787]
MRKVYKIYFSTIKYIFNIAKFSTVMIFALTILSGLLPGILVMAEENFINSLVKLENLSSVDTIVYPFLFLVLVLLLEWIFSIANKYLNIANREQIRNRIYKEMFLIVENTDFERMEEKVNQDLMMRVFNSPEAHFSTLIKFSFLIIKYAVTITSLFILLFNQVGLKSLIIVLASIIIAVIAKSGGQRAYNLEVENSNQKRKVDYYDAMLMDKSFADERILFSFFKNINNKWNKKATTLIDQQAKLSRTIFAQEKIVSVILYIISFVIIVLLVGSVRSGTISIGFMIAFLNATFKLSNMVSRVFADALSKIYKEIGYSKDFWDFQKLATIVETNQSRQVGEKIESIQFKNVSFKYPGTQNYVLKNCSFKMEGKRKYALIGINGSGKTTIVKLLKGLYKDYEGIITINNIDLRDITSDNLASEIAVVNQDFSKYQVSFIDNINLGRKHEIKNHGLVLDVFNKLDFNKVGGNIKLDSKIGKIYPENIDLSLGEWQKLVISRAILSEASLLILDEPTASLDPMAEQKVYDQISELSENKISLLISHRLGAVKDSEDIYLLEDGNVKIHGSHEELMKHSVLYKEMYNKQKGWYQNV